jgi:hypothetical protein
MLHHSVLCYVVVAAGFFPFLQAASGQLIRFGYSVILEILLLCRFDYKNS